LPLLLTVIIFFVIDAASVIPF
jgi:hypothetical protein